MELGCIVDLDASELVGLWAPCQTPGLMETVNARRIAALRLREAPDGAA